MRVPASPSFVACAAVGAVALVAGLASLFGPAATPHVAPAAGLAPAPCEAGHGEACKADVSPGAKGDVLASGGPQLLEFEAAYCSACATMAPVVKAVVASCAKAAGSVQHVDVESDKGEAIARRYDVAALPTFIAVDAEGREVFRRVGVQAPKEIASILAEVTGESCAVD